MICVIGIIGGSWLRTYERWGCIVEYKGTLYRREAICGLALPPLHRPSPENILVKPLLALHYSFSRFIIPSCPGFSGDKKMTTCKTYQDRPIFRDFQFDYKAPKVFYRSSLVSKAKFC